ncbi:hypothetical protein GCM10011575_30280 [Microlunatus endophyticus]|uniref:Uncharacterized protein n=1 Tax=Microlunatus endophyticus TaxID=1716077 RepID=A0A917SB93_9ACTN|nr:hypothetical protein [Microlunatus endophyticus]GGL69659.1 hypothetical protein GCM10011575_30280 [Microlunatus endophyticus]
MSLPVQELPLPRPERAADRLLIRLAELIKNSDTVGDVLAASPGPRLDLVLETFTPGRRSYSARLSPGWSATVTLREKHPFGPRLVLDIHGSPGAESFSDICQIAASRFIAILARAGFSNCVVYGEHNRRLGYALQRGTFGVELTTFGDRRWIRSVLVR